MIGLVHKNLIAGRITPMWVLIYFAFCIIAGIIIRSYDLFSIIILGINGGFVGNYLFQCLAANESNWQKLEVAMPVKAAYVELSRYLSHVTILVLTIIGSALYALSCYLSNAIVNICEECKCTFASIVFDTFMMWCGLFLFFGAVFFILSHVVKSNIAIAQIFSFVIMLAFLIGSSVIVGMRADGTNLVSWIILSATVLIYVGSYFLSMYLYKHKLQKKGAN